MFLEGKTRELADEYERRMTAASDEMRFEMAAKYRDLRKTVLAVSEQQKMAVAQDLDVDIFGFYREGARLALQLFTMREGKIVGRREFFWVDLTPDDSLDPTDEPAGLPQVQYQVGRGRERPGLDEGGRVPTLPTPTRRRQPSARPRDD